MKEDIAHRSGGVFRERRCSGMFPGGALRASRSTQSHQECMYHPHKLFSPLNGAKVPVT
ncbi:hypothetical protein CERSUDRAFT_115178 [Gelatoporia subvermispora B]|uniref:Uncharacterized protein n=1 Tax=Ceriporiopsis subvermispora (strain B) TaxID=914234 RepID=M2PJ53_CERS8|nr:hypothetical protein CERSUDRAFT_115178 [Gelatoporia subvermispora B]